MTCLLYLTKVLKWLIGPYKIRPPCPITLPDWVATNSLLPWPIPLWPGGSPCLGEGRSRHTQILSKFLPQVFASQSSSSWDACHLDVGTVCSLWPLKNLSHLKGLPWLLYLRTQPYLSDPLGTTHLLDFVFSRLYLFTVCLSHSSSPSLPRMSAPAGQTICISFTVIDPAHRGP